MPWSPPAGSDEAAPGASFCELRPHFLPVSLPLSGTRHVHAHLLSGPNLGICPCPSPSVLLLPRRGEREPLLQPASLPQTSRLMAKRPPTLCFSKKLLRVIQHNLNKTDALCENENPGLPRTWQSQTADESLGPNRFISEF